MKPDGSGLRRVGQAGGAAGGPAGSEGISGDQEDSALVRRCLKDDQAAFRLLLGRYQREVYNLSLRLVGSAEDAEDLTQETFLRAFRALDRYDVSRPFGAWLHTIATRLCIDHHRRNRAKLVSLYQPEPGSAGEGRELEIEDPAAGPEIEAEQTELSRRLEALVAELPPDSRAAILLRHQMDLSYEEIARSLGVPLGTIKARIHRARAMLRERLLAQGDIPWEGEEDAQDVEDA